MGIEDGARQNGQPLVSIIVPGYNQERTVSELLGRVIQVPYAIKEIIVVDDGGQDRTGAILDQWAGRANIFVIRHPHNRGKGAAVRTALAIARGEITVIQHADLEYDPADLPRLIETIQRGKSDVVYGSRYFSPGGKAGPWSRFRLAVYLLKWLVRLVYGRGLTDEATSYNVMRTDLPRQFDLQASRFDFCAEVTAKLCRLRIPIVEVPICYRPRTAQEGKKIGWLDACQTQWPLLRWRFAAVAPAVAKAMNLKKSRLSARNPV